MCKFAAAAGAEVRAPALPSPQHRYLPRQKHFYSPHDYEAMLLTPASTSLCLGESASCVDRVQLPTPAFG
jgi:hypothetical protein